MGSRGESSSVINGNLRYCTFSSSQFLGSLVILERVDELEIRGRFSTTSPRNQAHSVIWQFMLP